MHGTIIPSLALVLVLSLGSQWLAHRVRIPSIIVLLVVGFVCGPLTGLVDPVRDFGSGYKPLISLAVALILFEGGLTLDFRQVREVAKPVRRLIVVGAPLVGVATALAARHVAGLSWPSSAVIGAILVVTGPTVVGPLLRQARLQARPAAILRWEAIVNDALGALMAVVVYQVFLVREGATGPVALASSVTGALVFGSVGGVLAGKALVASFARGWVPEYLKLPATVTVVVAVYASANAVLEESGLLVVTVLGMTLANSRLAVLDQLRRFKETSATMLVGVLFIVLTASLTMADVAQLDLRMLLFIVLVLVAVRPVALMIALAGTDTTRSERLLVGWIAPRGIVAVAMAGLFGRDLAEHGVTDGPQMLTLAFGVVVASVVAHGLSLSPLARALSLRSTERPGVLLVGGSPMTTALAARLLERDIPVLVADSTYSNLSEPRLRGIPVYYGEVLSEEARHEIDFGVYSTVVASTSNPEYNALVCTDLGPEVGRDRVFEFREAREGPPRHDLSFTLGGRVFAGANLDQVLRCLGSGWTLRATEFTETFDEQDFATTFDRRSRRLLWRRANGNLEAAGEWSAPAGPGDVLFHLGPPSPTQG
ncbi:MAG: cation:proton antiporter [Nannocystaceae bacterium]|nr:sodium:proton antiporter [bacterium]